MPQPRRRCCPRNACSWIPCFIRTAQCHRRDQQGVRKGTLNEKCTMQNVESRILSIVHLAFCIVHSGCVFQAACQLPLRVVVYGLPPSAFEMSAMAFCARTLLPASSSGGETTAIPNFPGDTAMMPPPTPLLAGSPVR